MVNVLHVRAFQDNYIWLIRGKAKDRIAIVDPGDADPVLEALEEQQLRPAAILCTHHHGDHVGGVSDLLERYSVPVYGPARERISTLTHRLNDSDRIQLKELDMEFDVLDVPGHTAGHIAFFGHGMLFCGDTMFSAGCGRLFEGTAEQMHHSLSRMAALPEDTQVYCGHEYTEANLRFALTVEPENADTLAYQNRARSLRQQRHPTLPSTIGLEKRVNPFLRPHVAKVRQSAEKEAGRPLSSVVDVFAAIRRWKDGFRG